MRLTALTRAVPEAGQPGPAHVEADIQLEPCSPGLCPPAARRKGHLGVPTRQGQPAGLSSWERQLLTTSWLLLFARLIFFLNHDLLRAI